MKSIGTVESLWRYPVKGMRGEELAEAYLGFAGVFGDRVFAVRNSAGRKGFPYLTAREQRNFLQYKPRFRHPEKVGLPANLTDAENLAPGANPAPTDRADMMTDVVAPSGQTFAVDDPKLLQALGEGLKGEPGLSLLRSDCPMTDCRPLSLMSVQSVRVLSDQVGGQPIDQRNFRANVYLNLSESGVSENDFIGRKLQIGPKAVVTILERDPRCVMITLDPDTSEPRPEILRQVAQNHAGFAGVYAAVLVTGTLKKGDAVTPVE